MELRFLSSNKCKIAEIQELLTPHKVKVIPYSRKIEELQTKDSRKLIRHKILDAFSIIGRPMFVEHTGLHLEYLNDLPGGLTQVFWDSLEADRFCELFGQTKNTKAVAMTTIGFCDGHQLYYFDGQVAGQIACEPMGSREFQWDCVFIPDNYDKTFAQLGSEKNKISMRRKAIDEFISFLRKKGFI